MYIYEFMSSAMVEQMNARLYEYGIERSVAHGLARREHLLLSHVIGFIVDVASCMWVLV